MPSEGQFIFPFATRVPKYAKIASANTATQLTRTPWQLTVGYVIRKLIIANPNTTQTEVLLYDQDLSNTTPIAIGSNTAPIFRLYAPASAVANVAITNEYTQDKLMNWPFMAGIVAYNSQANCQLMVELELQ